MQSVVAAKRSGTHGPRLNRYYSKLKPYYRLDFDQTEENPIKGAMLPTDKTLIFESRFETGNLRKALKVGEFEYELFLKNDYGT